MKNKKDNLFKVLDTHNKDTIEGFDGIKEDRDGSFLVVLLSGEVAVIRGEKLRGRGWGLFLEPVTNNKRFKLRVNGEHPLVKKQIKQAKIEGALEVLSNLSIKLKSDDTPFDVWIDVWNRAYGNVGKAKDKYIKNLEGEK